MARSLDRAVIFDFNGTLSDDEPLLLRIFTELFADALGWTLTPEEYAERHAGRSDREIIDDVVGRSGRGDRLTDQLLERRRDRYLELVSEESPVRTGTVALVRRLGALGVPLGIVTGAQRPEVDHVLRVSGLDDAFTAIVTEEDVTRGKPHPEGFLRGAELLQVDPAGVVVFEDSIAGLRGARAAGMSTVAVIGTIDPLLLAQEADAVVDRLSADLAGLVRASPGP